MIEACEQSTYTKESAVQAIAMIRQNVATMGNNDREFERIDDVLARLDTDELSPDQAVDEANAIMYGKVEPTWYKKIPPAVKSAVL